MNTLWEKSTSGIPVPVFTCTGEEVTKYGYAETSVFLTFHCVLYLYNLQSLQDLLLDDSAKRMEFEN